MALSTISNGASSATARASINAAITAIDAHESTSAPTYATPLATVAADVGVAAIVAMTLTGALTLNVPTGTPKTAQRISYLFTASGGERTLTLHASLKVPSHITFTGAIASGSVRLLTLAWTGSVWLVVENLEYA